MKIFNFLFGKKPANPVMPIIFSIDMVIEGETDNASQDASGGTIERFQEHLLYSFSVEGKHMGWWERGSFINRIDHTIEEQTLAFFTEGWQSAYTITEEQTDDGILHVIFLFPQPALHETPYTKTQAHIVADWLRHALLDAQKDGQINAICEERVHQDYATAGIAYQ